ncbi:MAG: peptide chain release factor N(5)-glutamine methyltransferase [Pirellulales bacterium]
MSTTESWTVGRLLTWTADYLKKSGSPSPRLDAEVLLSHARGCQRIELYTAFDEEPTEQVRAAFREMVKRRAEGSPVAYLVGYKEFYSATFEVNPDVLIPRPETEHLVVEALDRAKELTGSIAQNRNLEIVDVGTGSGAIAVSIAKHYSKCHMTAVDISPAALSVAQRNAQRHGLTEDRIKFVEGDLLSWCNADQKFDLILSNPPYVSTDEFQSLAKSVKEFEPRLALVSEPSGGSIIKRLNQQAAALLNAGGYLIFEFSPMLAPQLPEMIEQPHAWSSPQITKDLAGHARIVTLRKL